MANAGYVGRDQQEVRRHIEELAKEGIPGPTSTPTLYPVVRRALITDSDIEVYGKETCGEVEYVLLIQDPDTIYVGLGSDHTDRHLEETDIPRAKQICPNILCSTVWPLSEVRDHWDNLILESWGVRDGEKILYQQGALELIMDPGALMEFVSAKVGESLERFILFSGTLGTVTGEFLFGDQFIAKLTDPVLGRALELHYTIHPLDYVDPDQE
jgi:hypothetical protein